MSIANVWLSAGRALVAVDTAVADRPGGSEREADKMVVFARSNFVLAGRGSQMLLRRVAWQLSMSQVPFDQSVLHVASIVDRAWAEVKKEGQVLGAPVEALQGPQVLLLVGYSQRTGRLSAERWETQDDGEPFAQKSIEWVHFGPGQGLTDADIDLEPSANKMMELARRQVAWGKQHVPEHPIGGRLIVAELTRDKMTVIQHAL